MKKKKRVLLLLLLPALLLLVGSCSGLFSQAAPDQAVAESRLKSLSSGENYRFVSRCHVNTEGEDREYFLLSGEKAGQNSHFRGSILGTELELYLVEDLLYQRNGQSNWRVNQVPQVQQVASLFAELDPAAAFSCTGIEDFEYLGPDESSPGRPHLLRLRPLAVGWVGEYFTNVR
ncbi:MAG: hypothetical protein Q4B50_03865 [Bacillota bacterium]|nr:hypothetical protein [Bacillota bacterium]